MQERYTPEQMVKAADIVTTVTEWIQRPEVVHEIAQAGIAAIPALNAMIIAIVDDGLTPDKVQSLVLVAFNLGFYAKSMRGSSVK